MNAFWIYVLVMGILCSLAGLFMVVWSKPLTNRARQYEREYGVKAESIYSLIFGGCVILAFSAFLIYAAFTQSTRIAGVEIALSRVGTSVIGPIIGWPIVVLAGLTLAASLFFVWWGRSRTRNSDEFMTEKYMARSLGKGLGMLGVIGSIPVLGVGLVILSY